MTPRRPKSALHLGCRIIPHTGGWLATIPRPRGFGRVRRWCKTIDAAREWIDANLSAIRSSADLSPPTPAEIALLRDLKTMAAGRDLRDLIRTALAIQPYARAATISSADAIEKFLSEKRASNLRPKTLENYTAALRRFPDADDLRKITPDDLSAAVADLEGRNHNNHLDSFSTLLRWALARGYCERDAAALVPRKRVDWTPPSIYTPEEIRRVLEASEAPYVPILAIAAFAGLRSSAILAIPADAVNLETRTITVPGYADKLRRGYVAEIPDNLAEWLRAYPFRRIDRPAKSIDNSLSLQFRAAAVPRRQNALRHSFASHYLALTGDAARTAALLGHPHDTATLFAHYRAIVTPSRARDYFSIRPDKSG